MSKKLTWTTEKRSVKDLLPADYNPRTMSEEERRELEDSINEFGQVVPIVVNIGKRKNVLIGGHQRTTIYADLGIPEVDVMVPSRELNSDEEKKLNLRLNKNTGSWDFEKLKDIDLTMLLDVGFGDEELQVFFDDVEILDDNFNVPKAIKEIKTAKAKPGDIFILGDHRIMCGDSTKEEDVKKLMGDELADVVYCDPPYNIGLDYNKGVENRKSTYGGQFTGKKDSKKDSEYASFVDVTLDNALAVSNPNTHVFYWCDEKYIWLMQELFKAHKVRNERVCMWIKNNSFPRPQTAFNKVYEPCVYGTRGKPHLNKNLNNLNEILNKEVSSGNQLHEEVWEMINIWLDKRDPTQEYEHPTQKPVTLAEKPLKRCSAPGQIILDLFGGSGSTLIACEQIKRKARLMELDPIFVDVIVNRWEEFTNQKAKKI